MSKPKNIYTIFNLPSYRPATKPPMAPSDIWPRRDNAKRRHVVRKAELRSKRQPIPPNIRATVKPRAPRTHRSNRSTGILRQNHKGFRRPSRPLSRKRRRRRTSSTICAWRSIWWVMWMILKMFINCCYRVFWLLLKMNLQKKHKYFNSNLIEVYKCYQEKIKGPFYLSDYIYFSVWFYGGTNLRVLEQNIRELWTKQNNLDTMS